MPKFKVVYVNQKILKAIGKKQNVLGLSDKNDTVIFLKNNYSEDLNERNIVRRLNEDLDVGREINEFKDDLFITLTNVNAINKINDEMPEIDDKLLKGLIKNTTNLKRNKRTNLYLERISNTHRKIYKVLNRIQEDLIDEQDTKIKHPVQTQQTVKKKKKRHPIEAKPKVEKKPKPEKAKGKNDNSFVNILAGVMTDYVKDEVKKAVYRKMWQYAGPVALKVGKFTLKWAEFILLLYYIGKNYYIADKSIDEPGCIEKVIFALYAGVTEWVSKHINLFSWVVDNFLTLTAWIKKHGLRLEEKCGKYRTYVRLFITFLDYMPMRLMSEYVLKPTFDYLKKNGAFGPEAGIIAVNMYRAEKDAIMNEIPNGKTFSILFGETKINDAIKTNVYKWNKFGKSQLRGSAEDIAKLLTKDELEEIQQHNDLDEYQMEKLKKALEIKNKLGIRDEDIKNNRKIDVALNSMIEALSKNMKFFDSDKEWKKLWIALAENSKEFVKIRPEATVITYLERDGTPVTLNTEHLLIETPYFFTTDATEAPKALCYGILKETHNSLKPNKDIFWFTPYGTVIIQTSVTDVIQSKRLIDKNIVKNPKLFNGALNIVYRVVGYFNTTFAFIKDFYNPNDIVFKKLFKYNIVTASNLKNMSVPKLAKFNNVNKESEENEKKKSKAPAGVPSYVAASYANADVDSNQGFVQDISPSETKKKVWDFFKKEFGMTDEQIAGIMGNLDVESGGFLAKHIQGEHFDKSASGKNDGMSGGLCQWHDVGNQGGRLSNLKAFAKKMGRDWRELDVQLLFLKYELETSYKRALKEVLAADTVEASTRAWVYHFEKPARKEDEVKKRLAKGNGYLKLYGSSAVNKDAGNIPDTTNNVSPEVNNETNSSFLPSYVPKDVNDTPEAESNPETNTSFKMPLEKTDDVSKGQLNPNDKQDNQQDGENSKSILDIAKKLIKGTVYSQDYRNKAGYFDCSSFVSTVLKQAGYKISTSNTTLTLPKTLRGLGFKQTGNASAKNQKGLQPGDILLKPGKHVMLYNGNGNVIEANGWKGNHNGINKWGSLHSKSDLYQVWRNSDAVISNATNDIDNASVNETYADAVNKNYQSTETIAKNNVKEQYNINDLRNKYNKDKNINNVIVNNVNNVNNKDEYEYEGMAEELFNIKITSV